MSVDREVQIRHDQMKVILLRLVDGTCAGEEDPSLRRCFCPCCVARDGLQTIEESAWLRDGVKVHYHSVISEKHDGKVYTVASAAPTLVGYSWVVWLAEKTGCVAIEALSPVEGDA